MNQLNHNLVSSVGRAPKCCGGGQLFEPQTRTTQGLVNKNNHGEWATFAITNAWHGLALFSLVSQVGASHGVNLTALFPIGQNFLRKAATSISKPTDMIMQFGFCEQLHIQVH